MGDGKGPVRLYYWNASRGADQLTASGRARVESSGEAFPHQARYNGGQWTVTLLLPRPPAGCPVAFAVWDGESGDRNGAKWFSVWYVLE
jgi:DMSO reductase family type II enzyme heme b subunit